MYQSRRGGCCGEDVVLTGKDPCGFPLKEGKLCSSFAYQHSSAGETLLILIIAQINGKLIRKLHNNEARCACVSYLLIGHGWCVPCAGLEIRSQTRGLFTPCSEQELSWLWGSLGSGGGAEPLGIATEERSVEPQHLSSDF